MPYHTLGRHVLSPSCFSGMHDAASCLSPSCPFFLHVDFSPHPIDRRTFSLASTTEPDAISPISPTSTTHLLKAWKTKQPSLCINSSVPKTPREESTQNTCTSTTPNALMMQPWFLYWSPLSASTYPEATKRTTISSGGRRGAISAASGHVEIGNNYGIDATFRRHAACEETRTMRWSRVGARRAGGGDGRV